MGQNDTLINLVAGGAAGTVGAVLTCPLEVIKTRLQSSNPGFTSSRNIVTTTTTVRSEFFGSGLRNFNVVPFLRDIVQNEGFTALFKGLGPNLLGVAPTRAIYFTTYDQSKKVFNGMFKRETPTVYILSAASAGAVSSTLTNPIWVIKTRLQLNRGSGQSLRDTVWAIYASDGIKGFYRGVSASYMGISETVLHFLIYETVKKEIRKSSSSGSKVVQGEDEVERLGCVELFLAGCFSKGVATCLTYPHETLRTRLREEGHAYQGLFQTLASVYRSEGVAGLYRGLGVQLMRQIPNMGIMMATYEISSSFLASQTNSTLT